MAQELASSPLTWEGVRDDEKVLRERENSIQPVISAQLTLFFTPWLS